MTYSELRMRQTGVLPENVMATPITIAGVGGIGSNTAYLLARMGFTSLLLVDPDVVEPQNIGTQAYSICEVGQSKVEALANKIMADFGLTVQTEQSLFTGDHARQVVISGLDSMAARQEVWGVVKDNPIVQWYLDGRMGLEIARCYALSPYNDVQVKQYEATLYDDTEGIQAPCTARSIGYNTYFVSAILASLIKQIATSQTPPLETIGDIGRLALAVTQK